MTKILVLYTELADYMLNAFEYYSNKFEAEFIVIHWPQNKEAPFVFNSTEKVRLIEKNSLSGSDIYSIYQKENINLIISSGWVDKDYVHALKKINKEVPSILALDNHYNASLRQKFLKLISPFFLKNIFSHAWVPGRQQKEYAKELTFDEDKILTGLYVANQDVFKREDYTFKRNFIYIGRYIEHKGINELFEAFISFNENSNNKWTLTCIGTGDLWKERAINNNIEHLGFVQPKEILKHINGGVFILPSHFEPWGVVVHEMCMAGYPLILSDKVGASSAFLDTNGFKFESKNTASLLNAMQKFDKLDEEQIYKMSAKSRELAEKISLENWSIQLQNILNKS